MKSLLSFLCIIVTGTLFGQPLFQEAPPRRPRTFDVVHYNIVVSFNEAKKEVHGNVLITLTPLLQPLDTVILDAEKLTINSVLLTPATNLRFESSPTDLKIFLPQSYQPNDTITVGVDYSCIPEKGLYFIQPDSSEPNNRWQIWTQGEDMENRYWLPCYDFPDDKATSEVTATVSDRYTLLSNGLLASETTDTSNHDRTFHWIQSKPHASYLIMLAAGEYTVLHDTTAGVPLSYYVYPENAHEAARSFRRTPEMMNFFEQEIGFPYPWGKFAQIFIDKFMWGGMENTSAVTLNKIYVYDSRAELDFSADDVVAHELAHQWWGDVVTCRDWTHMWLNEGFATYYEGIFKRHDMGEDEFQYEAYSTSRSVRQAEESLGRKPVVSVDSYSENVYSKGAWVLRMLNGIVGEEKFKEIINHYITKYQFTSVSSEDFANAVKDITGEDFDWFFDQWLYKEGHPKIRVTSRWDEDGKHLKLVVTQEQRTDSLTGLFLFPLDIECTTSGGPSVTRIWVSQQEESFIIPLDERPLMVIVDKGLKVLKTLIQEKSRDENIYQVLHADDVPNRLDALDSLASYKDDFEVFQAVKSTAFNDGFWAVRARATRVLAGMERQGTQEFLVQIYQDKSSRVREAAIAGLSHFKTPEAASFIESTALHDSSYVVVSACLRTMAAIDSARATTLALRYVDTESYSDMTRRASLDVLRLTRDREALPLAMKYCGTKYRTGTRIAAVAVLREGGKQNRVAREFVEKLISDPNSFVRASAVRTLHQWDAVGYRDLLTQRREIEKDEDVQKAIDDALGTEEGHSTDAKQN